MSRQLFPALYRDYKVFLRLVLRWLSKRFRVSKWCQDKIISQLSRIIFQIRQLKFPNMNKNSTTGRKSLLTSAPKKRMKLLPKPQEYMRNPAQEPIASPGTLSILPQCSNKLAPKSSSRQFLRCKSSSRCLKKLRCSDQ